MSEGSTDDRLRAAEAVLATLGTARSRLLLLAHRALPFRAVLAMELKAGGHLGMQREPVAFAHDLLERRARLLRAALQAARPPSTVRAAAAPGPARAVPTVDNPAEDDIDIDIADAFEADSEAMAGGAYDFTSFSADDPDYMPADDELVIGASDLTVGSQDNYDFAPAKGVEDTAFPAATTGTEEGPTLHGHELSAELEAAVAALDAQAGPEDTGPEADYLDDEEFGIELGDDLGSALAAAAAALDTDEVSKADLGLLDESTVDLEDILASAGDDTPGPAFSSASDSGIDLDSVLAEAEAGFAEPDSYGGFGGEGAFGGPEESLFASAGESTIDLDGMLADAVEGGEDDFALADFPGFDEPAPEPPLAAVVDIAELAPGESVATEFDEPDDEPVADEYAPDDSDGFELRSAHELDVESLDGDLFTGDLVSLDLEDVGEPLDDDGSDDEDPFLGRAEPDAVLPFARGGPNDDTLAPTGFGDDASSAAFDLAFEEMDAEVLDDAGSDDPPNVLALGELEPEEEPEDFALGDDHEEFALGDDDHEPDSEPSRPRLGAPRPIVAAVGTTASFQVGPPRTGPSVAIPGERAVQPDAIHRGAPAPVDDSAATNVDDDVLSLGGDDDEDYGSGVGLGGGLRVGMSDEPKREAPHTPRLTDEDDAPDISATVAGDDVVMDLDMDMLETVAEVDTGEIQRFMQAAATAEAQGDLHQAITHYSDVLDVAADHIAAFLGRGRAQLELGDYAAAFSDFQRAEDLAPRTPEPLVEMGNVFFARKSYARAMEFFDRAVEADDSHAPAYLRRGMSHFHKNNPNKALTDLRRAQELDPTLPLLEKYLAMVRNG